MSEPRNEAAWIMTKQAPELEVKESPMPIPEAEEVVIKVAYAAVNPSDWKNQHEPFLDLPYPFIFGSDVSGIVTQVGSAVTKFKIVAFNSIVHAENVLCPSFQTLYHSLANASVLPLGLNTAATGLYHDLKLPLPSLDPKPTGKTILIWGGSSSCGSSAIQLAVASGMRVITTASKANFDYVKNLGASEAFDYRAPDVVDQLKKAMKEGDLVFDCISEPDAQMACAEILPSIGGSFLPLVLKPVDGLPSNVNAQPIFGLAPAFSASELKELPYSWGTGAAPHVGVALWHDFLPEALKTGKFQAKPDPYVIKDGLPKVQEGMTMVKGGISAKKVVIELAGEA